MFSQGAGADFDHHGRELTGSVKVLLHGIHDALAGSEVYRAAALNGVGSRTTLSGVLAFGFNRYFLLTPNIEFTEGERLLIDLTTFSRWRDRVEDTAFRDTGLHMLRDQIVAVAGDADAGVARVSGL